MKARTLFLLVLTVLLLLGIAGAVQSGGSGPAAGYEVQPGTASGGAYRLTSLAWQVSGSADGGGYLLQAVGRTIRGSGCCCAYLPCILRGPH